MEKVWKIKEHKDIPKEIINAAGSGLLAQLLVQRGMDTVQKITDFLNPSQMKITSPFVFCDMQKSVDRIFDAIEKQEKIIIYGDFDCDGVTSTSLLYKTLTHLGANVEYYIPNRENENHGLNTKALVKLIAKQRAKLIITVDCGVSDVEQVAFANGFKVDVIITDHHEAPAVLPEAYAIINPKAVNALDKDLNVEQISALNELAGVGVAFKLACALLETKQDYDFANNLLPFVAVGTIADVVPILYENRSFVYAGLKLIESGVHYGLTKLLESGGYEIKNGVTSENIAFGIAPRINAAGRLDTVEPAVKLLISDNKSEIDMCVEELNNFNRIRQDICEDIFNEAVEMIQNEPPQDAIVLYKQGWHIGIIGIVASKLVEKFYKPVFLMTTDENTGFVRCSSRSIPEVHIRNVIADNDGLFEYFGGHSQAAGLVFDPKKSPFEKVKSALLESIKQQLDGKELAPCVNIDLELEAQDINIDLIDTLKRLEPFGEGNKTPVFAVKNLMLSSFKTMGQKNNHLKIFCESSDGRPFECVYWNHDSLNIPQGKEFDVVFYPKLNVFNGITTIQLDVQDVKSEFAVKDEKSDFKLYDHRKKTNIFRQICDYLLTTKVSTEIFAQSKPICDTLKTYKEIAPKIRSRKNLSKCAQIMFFDYPTSEAALQSLIKKSGAKILHFMNYNNRKIDAQELVKNISGMLKYVCTNKNGEVNLNDISDFLAVSDEVTELCFDMLEELGMFDVIEKNANTCRISFSKAVELSKIKESEMYEELETELAKIYDYRQKLSTMPLEELIL